MASKFIDAQAVDEDGDGSEDDGDADDLESNASFIDDSDVEEESVAEAAASFDQYHADADAMVRHCKAMSRRQRQQRESNESGHASGDEREVNAANETPGAGPSTAHSANEVLPTPGYSRTVGDGYEPDQQVAAAIVAEAWHRRSHPLTMRSTTGASPSTRAQRCSG